MDSSDQIAHRGIVTNLVGDKAIIQLIQPGSCHSCSIKGFCGVEDDDRSRFEVSNAHYAIGDRVNVDVSPNSGFKATFWAYLFPFIMMFAVIAVGTSYGYNEGLLGGIALLLLIPYYLLLSAFKKYLTRHIHLHVKKL